MIQIEEHIQKAKNYVRTNARPIDRELYLYEFEQNNASKVLTELLKFQNEDGGFGNAIEPDLRMPQSSPIATTVAFQYLNEIKNNIPNELVQSGINYFIQTKEEYSTNLELDNYWPSTSLAVNSYLHAPWWELSERKEPKLADWPNPNVEIIGYLLQHEKFVPKELLISVKNDLETFLELQEKLTGFIYYNFLCFKRILPHVSTSIQQKIFALLDNTFKNQEMLDHKNLQEIRIQNLVTEESSYFYKKYPDKVREMIMNELTNLGSDGGCHPGWKWGEEPLWSQVEKEWTGKLTYKLLVTLKYTKLAKDFI